jgi:hypothetical protein
MNKIIIKNGFFGGLIVSIVLIVTTIFVKVYPDKEPSMVLGFTSMLLAFIFVIIGIRENKVINGAKAGFWKSFYVGLNISFIISSIHVLVWLIVFYNFFPDFMEKHSQMIIKNTSAINLEAKTIEMNQMKELYKNPFYVVLYTYLEIFPLGILVSFFTATFISLRRKLLKK